MRRLILEPLEDRILYSAEPVATVAAVSEEFINDDFTFEVNFDNAAPPPVNMGDPDNVGYAPFIDVTVQQGITVNGATYLGTNATLTEVGTWDAVDNRWEDGSGNAIAQHPYGAGLDLPPGNAQGDTWYRVDLPFGSFTPDQPVATVVFDATLDEAQGAQVAVPLEITAQGGFRFGNDPLNNPGIDPPLQQDDPDLFQITPTVMELHKELIAPEAETATGPNFERQYRLVIDIAEGQTIEDLNVTDLLPDNIVLVGTPTITGGGSYTDNSTLAIGNPSNSNQFDVTFNSVTGTSSGEDIVIEFTFYVPEFDADGQPVLDPVTGGDSIAFNEAEASGTYMPAVGAPMLVSDSGQPDNAVELQLEALAIQKGATVVDNGTPGGTLASDYIDYTLDFQVSDYFSIDTLVITDVLSDGQRIDPGTPFTLTLVENGNPLSVDIDPAYIDITLLPGGEQQVVIRLSEFLVDQGLDGTLDGDQYDLDGALGAGTARDNAGDGGTVGTITYRAQILQNFDETYPSGDQSVDLNDLLSNAVVITGRVGGTTNQVGDDSGTETQIAPWESQKTIYAINGETAFPDTQISPGDSVTYRIQVTLPAADIENLVITDFLPLPVFNVGSEFAGVTQIDPFTGVPAAGTISFGPNNTLATLPGPDNTFGTGDDTQPVVSIDAAGNRLIITYGTFNDIEQTGSYTIELLYTVTATDRPFADNLLLTNQAVISTGTTNNGPQQQTEIDQITLRQPDLVLTKGVLDSDSPNEEFFKGIGDPDPTIGPLPGSFTSEQLLEHPIDADVGGLDAGDTVTFAITVMNTGGEDAFDIVLTDVFPPGFVMPSDPNDLQLTVTRGDGTALTFSGSALDLFGTGLQIDDLGGNTGALAASGDNGSDVLVLTYKLVVDQSVVPGGGATNTATLASFAAREGGYDFTTDVDQEDFIDSAGVGFAGLAVAKQLTDSDQAGTTGDDLTIGEVATYTITVTLPEGTIPADIVTGIGLVVSDSLPAGFEIIPGSVTLVSGGFGGTINDSSGNPLSDGAILSDSLVLNFGEIATSDDNVTGNNSFSITYQVRVVNDAGLSAGDQLVNTVTADADTDAWNEESDSDTASVVLPDIVVEKDVDASNVDGGDPVEYTIVIRNDGSSPSYDTTFSDVFPNSLNTITLVSAVSSGNGDVIGYFQVVGNTITQVGSGFTLAVGESVTLTVTAQVNELETEGLTITNTATATGTSLPGDHPDDEYSDTDSDDAVFSIAVPQLTKEIIATSSLGTTGATAAIGETVTYEMVITVPEATVPLTLTDTIPAGMSLVSAEVISISPQIQGADIGVGGGPSSTSSGSVTFDFGEVTNESDGANTPDTIVVRVTLRVDNVVANQDEVIRTNVATLDYGSGSTTDNAGLEIVEPDLTVTKTVAPDGDGRDAGDTVSYTITIQHSASSGSDAYELSFSDPLPAQLTGAALSGADAALFQIIGNEVVFVGSPDLAIGGTITVTVTATLVDAVTPGQVIGNAAEITWTSLDGVDATERGGADGEGGALNDYARSDDVDITVTEVLDIAKELVDPAQATATIGETVGYQLTIDLMEGTTSNLVVTDVLAAGMVYVPGSAVVTLPSGMTGGYVENYDAGSRTLTFTFVSIVVEGDNGTANNAFTITYDAQVQNVSGNQSGTDLQNNAQVEADDLDTANDDLTIEVVEPDLQVVKGVSPTTADAGDTVTYTITISHTGASTADAYDVLLDDLFPGGVTDVTITGVSTTGGASASLADFGLDLLDNRHVVTTGDVDIPQGGTVTLTITATVINEIEFGETVDNTAEVTWTSLDGVVTGERDGSGGEAGDPNNYHDDDDASFAVQQATVDKTIVSTSAGHTGTGEGDPALTDLTIGETVTYHIVVTLPEGQIDQLVVSDLLPAGLELVSYDIGAGVSDGSISFDMPATVDTSGNPLTFTFDNLINPVGGNNQLVIAVTAVVANEAGNQAGDVLTNSAEISYTDGDDQAYSDSDSIDVDLVEPDLTVTKTVAPDADGRDAGDTVTYTITIQHSAGSSADAFDLVFSDEVPPELTGITLGGANAGLFQLTGNTISFVGSPDLAMGGSLTLTVTGTLANAVEPGQVIGNEAAVTWTSLDGTDAEERGGADGEGGALNDYAASDDVDITLNDTFELSKALALGQDDEATIGEEVAYTLQLELIEGTTGGVVITDVLPVGMTYVPGSAVVTAPAGGSFVGSSVVYNPGTNTITISFDSITVPGDNVGTNNYITIDYLTVVQNVTGNQSGTELTNTASAIALGDLSDDADGEPTVTVIEPDLQVVKGVSPTTADAGDTVTYTITISHTGASTADAYDVLLDDLFPGGVTDVTITGVSTTGGASASLADFGLDLLDNRHVVTTGDVDIPQGGTVTLTITATVINEIEFGETVDNTAEVTWTSLDGVVTGERDGSGGEAGDPNNYHDDDDASFAVQQATVDKTIVSTSAGHTGTGEGDPALTDLTIGETVTYHIVVTLPEGQIDQLVVSDLLPAGLELVSYDIGAGVSDGSISFDMPATVDTSGNPLTFTFDNLINPVGGNNQLVIAVTAVVANEAGNQAGDVLTNSAEISYTDGDDQAYSDSDSIDVDLVEPDLTVTKTVAPDADGRDAGDTVTYTITIQHSAGSSADAFDLVFSDEVPPELTGITLGGANAGLFQLTGNTISFVGSPDLAMGGNLTLTVTGTLANAVEPGQVIGNEAAVTWTSLDGTDAEERGGADGEGGALNDYAGSDDVDIEIDSVFDLQKALASGQAATATIGEQVNYELTLTLIEGTTENVVITDDLPDGMALVGNQVMVSIAGGTPFAVSVTPPAPGGQLVIDLGDVVVPPNGNAADNTVVVTYSTVVLNVVGNQDGVELTNSASATAIDANDTELSDAGEETTVTVVEPDLEVIKDVTPASGLDAGDTVTYTITIQHTGASTADAYDIEFLDYFPIGIDVTNVVVGGTSGATAADFTIELPDDRITANSGLHLQQGQTIVLTVTGVLRDSVQPGETIVNDALINWTSLEGDVGGERTGNDGAGGALDDYAHEDDASIEVERRFDLEKALAAGGSTDVMIGDTVSYELTLHLIEGTTRGPVDADPEDDGIFITDTLPFGMSLVTASVQVYNGTTLLTEGVDYELSTTAQGFTVTMIGNTVIAGDNDTTNDFLRVTYDATVDNVPENEAGGVLINAASAWGVDWDSNEMGGSDELTLTIIEPSVSIDKSVDSATGYDAGDTVTYTVTLAAAGGTTAYDLVFTDVIGPEFSGAAVDVVITGPDAALFSYDPGTRTISIAAGTDLPSGEDLEFTVQVTLASTVEPNQVITNDATIEWTSLDGDVPGERTNDASDSVDIAIDGTFELTKAFGDGQAAQATIGEQVGYELTLQLIEGVTENVVITDELPDGMDFVGTQVMVSIAGGTPFAVTVTPPGPGGTLTIDLGDVTVPADNLLDNNLVVITYTTVVLNDVGNQAGGLLVNEASATADDADGNPLADEAEDEPELRIVEPALDITKTVAPMTGDAGDPITYTITISNPAATYGADAFDLVLSDLLPPGFTPGTGPGDFTVTGADPSAFTLVGNQLSSDGQVDLAMGAANIVITITGTLNDTVQPGEFIVNEASLTWSSLDDQGSAPTGEERDGADGPLGALDDYAQESSASLLVDSRFEVDKTLAGGGLTGSATIGQSVDYEVTLTLIEGTTHNVVVTDQLPAGMAYDGNGVTVTIAGSTVAVPSGSITWDAGTGLLVIDLGDVTIPGDNVPGNDTAVLAYAAVVQNLAGNQDGTTLENSVSAEAEDGDGGELGDDSDDNPVVTVVEPDLEVVKEVDPASGLDAGDTVTYTITIQHTGDSTADAFDIAFSDAFPPGVDVTTVVVGGSGGATAANFTIDLAGDSISANAGLHLQQGQTIVLTVTGVLRDSVQPDETIVNEATITWSSLEGDVDGERDGEDGEGGALNDYADDDDASLTTDRVFALEKALAAGQGDEVVIGETVDFELTLTLIEGTTHGVVITDQLPAGMAYDGNGVSLTIAGSTVAVPAGNVAWDAGSGLLTIDLGDVTIPGDNVDGNNTATLTYGAVVLNVVGNQDGTTLTNSAGATGEDADGDPLEDDDNEITVTVVEPDLEVVKEVDPASGLDAGDTITYTITIQHTGDSSADAFDITFSDAFPPGVDVTAVVVGGTGGATASNFTIDLANETIAANPGLHLQQGQTIVLTVTATLQDSVGQNEAIVNEAAITWSSLDGDVDGERDGSGDENDYADDDDAELVTTEVFDLVKELANGQPSTVTIGSTVDYQLTLSLIEGTTYGVVVTDDLPDGMAFVGSSVMVSIGGATPVAVTVTPPAPGGVLTIDLGDVVIEGDNDGANNTVVITYSAVVQDVLDNVRGLDLVNGADATGEDANGDELADGDEADDEATVTIAEPDLDIVKSVDDATPEPGQVITYTVTVSHNAASDADAMDVLIGDLITDPNLTLVPGSVQVSGSAAGSASVLSGNTAGDAAIQVGLPTLAQGDTITITYQVTVAADATIIGDTLSNTATVDYDSIPGEDQPEERDYEESDDEDVLVLSPDLTIEKSVDDETLSPGDTTFYTLSIDNVGATGSNTATNVVVSDVLPLGLTYVSATGLPPGASASYDAGTRTVTISGFDMDAGDGYDIVINVSVDTPAPAGALIPGSGDDETLTNTASIAADNFEPTPEDNEDEVDVTLEADPDLAVTKVANVTQVVNGGQITYTLTVENLGNQISTGVVLTDQLDLALVDFVAASNGGSYDPISGVVTWNLASLSPEDGPQVFTLTVEIKDTVPAGPNTVDNVTHVEDDGQSGPESDDSNNDDGVQVTLISVPDLMIDKQVDTTSAIQGDALTYTITVTNNGLQGATGIVITDDLPNGIKFVSASDGGVFDPVTGDVVWSGISLAAGESITVTLEVRIPDLYNPGNALNSVSVVDDGTNGPDATPEDNVDSVVTKIDARYVYNALNGSIFDDDEDEEPFGRPWDWRPPLLPIDPIYSGTADPGTQLRLVIYSDRGTELASQFVMADTGGNWLASFPGATLQDRPHEVRVIQDAGINSNAGFLFNFRTYFSPAANPQQFFSEVGGVGGPGTFASSDLLDAMIQGFLNPVFQPNPSLYSYEFLPSSSTTTQYAN